MHGNEGWPGDRDPFDADEFGSMRFDHPPSEDGSPPPEQQNPSHSMNGSPAARNGQVPTNGRPEAQIQPESPPSEGRTPASMAPQQRDSVPVSAPEEKAYRRRQAAQAAQPRSRTPQLPPQAADQAREAVERARALQKAGNHRGAAQAASQDLVASLPQPSQARAARKVGQIAKMTAGGGLEPQEVQEILSEGGFAAGVVKAFSGRR